MEAMQNHPVCWSCKHLESHEEDSELHNGNAIIWYTCRKHQEMSIEEPMYQYCSCHIERKGGKHDAAII